MKKISKVPPINFSRWTTSRIKFLLSEYKSSNKIQSVCIRDWIRAMETELKNRNELNS